MKKVLFALIALLLVTGCGGSTKRLLCSQKVQTVDVDMIADFKGDELTYLGLKYEIDLTSYTDAQVELVGKQDMCSTVKASMSSYTNAFTNCKQKIDNKILVITADFDLDKLVGADISKKTSIEEAKKELEKQNYSCTVSNKDI